MADAFDGLYRLPASDVGRAAAVLTAAFRADPIWSRIFEAEPDLSRRAAAFEAPIKFCRRYGSVYATSPNLEGVAAFAYGESADMTVLRMILSGAMSSGMRMGLEIARRLELVFRPVQADRRENMRGRPYVYLVVLGVGPEFQGKGWGGKLLRGIISHCRERGRALYLDTETEANVRMYEHYGFRTIKQIVLPELGLPMWEMVKDTERG